jgi:hypothetical protein
MTQMKNREYIQRVAEIAAGQPLDFIHYGTAWVFAGDDIVVKVSEHDLAYAASITKFLSEMGFPALAPIKTWFSKGYFIYIYPKGVNTVTSRELVPWMGHVLRQLHQIKFPKSKGLVTYAELKSRRYTEWSQGLKLLPADARREIERAVDAAVALPLDCLNHGDPHITHNSNTVRIAGKLMLIDWDNAVVAPRELDLAIVKYAESFGEPEESFQRVVKDYGPYSEQNLAILSHAESATSVLWFANNVAQGHFSDTSELSRRIARLMGDTTVILRTDYKILG